MSDAADPITLHLHVDGYDVQVFVHASTIARRIADIEKDYPEEINRKGFRDFDLERFVNISVEPTDEKWKELSDREFGDYDE